MIFLLIFFNFHILNIQLFFILNIQILGLKSLNLALKNTIKGDSTQTNHQSKKQTFKQINKSKCNKSTQATSKTKKSESNQMKNSKPNSEASSKCSDISNRETNKTSQIELSKQPPKQSNSQTKPCKKNKNLRTISLT